MKTPKLKAYMKQIESGKLKSDKAKILDFIIKRNGSNIIHMKSLLNIEHQTLTARLSQLEDDGVIYVSGLMKNTTHSIFKYQPDPILQLLYARNRKFEKFLALKKSMLKNYSELMDINLIKELSK